MAAILMSMKLDPDTDGVRSPPLPISGKIAVTAFVWSCIAPICLPLQEVVSTLPFCVGTPWRLNDLPTCLLAISLVKIDEFWRMDPDVGSVMGRYWPAGLMASVLTTFLLWSWWRRS